MPKGRAGMGRTPGHRVSQSSNLVSWTRDKSVYLPHQDVSISQPQATHTPVCMTLRREVPAGAPPCLSLGPHNTQTSQCPGAGRDPKCSSFPLAVARQWRDSRTFFLSLEKGLLEPQEHVPTGWGWGPGGHKRTPPDQQE